MNRLITTKQIADYLKTADSPALEPHLAMAHAIVAANIITPSLDERSKTERRTFTYDAEVVVFKDGPVASVQSITLNGATQDLADYEFGHWTLRRADGERFTPRDQIVIAYKAGYQGIERDSAGEVIQESNAPEGIQKALILTSADLFNMPNTSLAYEKIGDYIRQTISGVPGKQNASALDPKTMLLLAPFCRPRL